MLSPDKDAQHLPCGHHKDCLLAVDNGPGVCGWCSEEHAYDALRKQAKETEAALRKTISDYAAIIEATRDARVPVVDP